MGNAWFSRFANVNKHSKTRHMLDDGLCMHTLQIKLKKLRSGYSVLVPSL